MPEFLTLKPPDEALELFLSHLDVVPEKEIIKTTESLNRVTGCPIISPHPLTEFPRSTVDGYAVRASDTFGAGENLPAYLNLIGEVPMGDRPGFIVKKTECAIIHTGGMVPEGSNAVVMIENTQLINNVEVEILRSAGVGENIIRVGEDIQNGDEVIQTGVQIRPAEIGGMMALGVTQLEVAKKPIVGIISSGDEVIHPKERPKQGQVRDVNAYTLKSLIEKAGGIPIQYGIIPDTEESMYEAASKARKECDVVVITAGSSASTRDLTSIVIDRLGKPGVLVHGVNVRPGKPTILAVCDGKAMIGLPGNPVSALVIAGLFVVPLIRTLLGVQKTSLQSTVQARLTINLSSQAGREDWIPVQLEETSDGYDASPIFGRSNLIFALARADGLVRIPPSATGIEVGDEVDVYIM